MLCNAARCQRCWGHPYAAGVLKDHNEVGQRFGEVGKIQMAHENNLPALQCRATFHVFWACIRHWDTQGPLLTLAATTTSGKHLKRQKRCAQSRATIHHRLIICAACSVA
jgi:hypothetical protein